MDTATLSGIARKAALENAIKHKGKASQGAVIGSCIQQYPQAKEDMKTTAKEIAVIIKEINSLSLEEQEQALLALDPQYYEKEQEKKAERKAARQELPELEGATQGQVITRMCPEPSKYNHLGHALNFLINYLYAQKYEGQCVLRFEDTNPEKEEQEFVEAMQSDVLEYLDIKPDKILFVSDNMPRYYDACEDLINRGLAYTDTTKPEEMSKQRREMQESSCRNKDKETVMQEWKKMLSGEQAEGTMTLRLKIDMEHKNAVMRDPVIMRIMHAKHYRQGEQYKVWPMYDFENALEDSWNEVTHVMRSNEFETRIELQNHIKELFNLEKQYVRQYGRFNIVGATTQGREIRELIEKGEVIGWDDPRLVTLRALKRRGIVKEAFYELVKQAGMSKNPTNIGFEVLAAINRNLLDEQANRYFFVKEPIKITIENWPEDLQEAELKLHPHKNRGGRKFTLSNEYYISKKDYDEIIKGKVFRFIDTINLQYKDGHFVVHSKTMDEFKQVPAQEKYGLIHFLPAQEELVTTKIFMPDATYEEGLAEPTIKQLREGAHIQFERHCFARLDNIESDGSFVFWHTHE